MPAMPMALNKPPMVVGIRQTSSAMSTASEKIHAGVNAERFQRDDGEQKHDRERREQNRERDFVRRLLAARAFDERNHAVQKTFAGIGGDADFDFVREHARAAGDGAAVAAGFADDRRGFAGDGGFIHRRRAENDFAVGGNDFVGAHENDIAFAERIGIHGFNFAVAGDFVGARARAGLARSALACALPRPSATASAKFANSTVNQSQMAICATNSVWPGERKMSTVLMAAPTSVTNMTGFFTISRGFSFYERVADGRAREFSGQKWKRFSFAYFYL